jgi:hypothetical protein
MSFTLVTTFKQRGQWSRAIARNPDVKLSHRNVLRSLADLAELDDNNLLVINRTYDELAKACLCHRATAIRAVALGVEIGIVRKAQVSDGRVSNSFELLLPDAGSNGSKSVVFNGAKTDDQSGSNGRKFEVTTVANLGDGESSNGCYTGNRLKAKRKEEVVSKNSKRQGRVLTVSQSPALTAVTASALHVLNPACETADAARWNPACLNHTQQPEFRSQPSAQPAHGSLCQPRLPPFLADVRPEFSTDASCLDEGRGGFANGGLPIDEANVPVQQLQWIEPPPTPKRSREPQSYFEAAYGDAS